jgi:hypothetical protein
LQNVSKTEIWLMTYQKVIYYTDNWHAYDLYHKMAPSDITIFHKKTIKLCSFSITERINGSGILS